MLLTIVEILVAFIFILTILEGIRFIGYIIKELKNKDENGTEC